MKAVSDGQSGVVSIPGLLDRWRMYQESSRSSDYRWPTIRLFLLQGLPTQKGLPVRPTSVGDGPIRRAAGYTNIDRLLIARCLLQHFFFCLFGGST